MAIAVVATVGDAAMAPALSVGPISTPTTVSTPSVNAPSTTVTVPNVPVPKVTPSPAPAPVAASPPKVSAPPKVTTPHVTVPSTTVTTPKVSAPPKVSTPPIVKKTTGGGSSGASPGGSGSSGSTGGLVDSVKKAVPNLAAGGSTPGAAGGIARNVGGGVATQGAGNSGVSPLFTGVPGGPGGGPGPGGGASSGPGGPGGLPSAFALGFQPQSNGVVFGAGTGGVTAFAAAVAAYAGCFYALTPFEQQVLVVRSGIDGRRALSRSTVATLLGTTPAAIAATEKTALVELRGAADGTGCMPVLGFGPANAMTAFIGGPFGPVGYVTPGLPGPSREEPGVPQETNFASSSFADRLATLSDGGQASMSLLVVIAVMLTAALGALLVEARRSVT